MRGFLTPLLAFCLMAATSFAAVNIVSTARKQTPVAKVNQVAEVPQVLHVVTPAQASLPITVTRGQYVSRFSGTAIGENKVLTCAHGFRERGGTIKVDGNDATLIKIDHEADVALLAVKNKIPFIGFAASPPAKNEAVTAYGFERGRQGLWKFASRITGINRYLGFSNLSIAGTPRQGRSGGGLFNAAGELVGVCSAADGGEGLYAGHAAIKKLLGGEPETLTVSYQAPADNCPNGQCFAKPAPSKAPAVQAACQCQAPCPCEPAATQPAAMIKQSPRYASRGRFFSNRPVRGFFGRIFKARPFAGFRARSCCS